MSQLSVIKGKNIQKKYKGFQLDVPSIEIPKGFATALIGENGAGKTTLLNLMAGIRLDYKGELTYFDEEKGIDENGVKEYLGYTAPGNFFLPHWTIKQVVTISKLLFPNFHEDRFYALCDELGIDTKNNKQVKTLSDGNRMKLMLAAVLARDTRCLILDEPASPLDPLMRDKLCDMIREYLTEEDGERSVFFSTHNISDMESVTDYAIIMEHGTIVEQGFVEDLKEKYVVVKGDVKDIPIAEEILFSITKNAYGFEGICLAERMDELSGIDVTIETPNLSQICVAIMKKNTKLKRNS